MSLSNIFVLASSIPVISCYIFIIYRRMKKFREFKGEKVNNFRRSKMLKVMYYGYSAK